MNASRALSIIVSVAALASAAGAAEIKTTQGHVEFLAIGKPSAIKIRGKGDKLSSQMQFKDKTLAGKFMFDLSSLDTGIDTRNTHMKEKYLETAKFKDAELNLKSLKLTQDICKEDVKLEKSPFEGTLKLHGVEQPVKGEFDVTSKKGQGHSQVRFNLLITDYKIDIPSYMGIKVTDKVENTIDLDWSCKE
jgi:polyisoprenoid-binding protein YceI